MRAEVLMAVIMEFTFFRDVILCSSLNFILLLFCFSSSFLSSYVSSFLLPQQLIPLFLIYSIFLLTTSFEFIFIISIPVSIQTVFSLLQPSFPPIFFPFHYIYPGHICYLLVPLSSPVVLVSLYYIKTTFLQIRLTR